MVGISPKDNRPSYFVFKYLKERGYRMIPDQPGQAGKEILGQKVYAKLSDIPEPVDMVDIFPRLALFCRRRKRSCSLQTADLMQLTIRNDEAASLAEVMVWCGQNRCPKIEYGRLSRFPDGGIRAHSPLSAQNPAKGVQRMGLGHDTLQGGTTDATDRAQKVGRRKTRVERQP